MKKISKIILVVLEPNGNERKRPFDKLVAERLLNMSNNGGWKLPEDSKYTLKDGSIIVKPKEKPKADLIN